MTIEPKLLSDDDLRDWSRLATHPIDGSSIPVLKLLSHIAALTTQRDEALLDVQLLREIVAEVRVILSGQAEPEGAVTDMARRVVAERDLMKSDSWRDVGGES